MTDHQLLAAAQAVLKANDQGDWMLPTSTALYPHQWLWDTFFHAIGQRHYDIGRAQVEIRSPFRAQWRNGMLPHIIFSQTAGYQAGPEVWKSSETSTLAPRDIETSAVTQPPMAAEATVLVGKLLPAEARRAWYHEMYPKILAWHQMLYRERDPREDGLVRIFLSWESGMDNSPPLMDVLHRYALSDRIRLMEATGLDKLAEHWRHDTRVVPLNERISTLDLEATYGLIHAMRRNHYDYRRITPEHRFQVVDLAFNCILIRANDCLKLMADTIGATLPPDIQHAMHTAPYALETLWDEQSGYYYSRDAISGRLIKMPGMSTLLPLYAIDLPEARTRRLLSHLHDSQIFAAHYPIPTVPLNSAYFNPHRYWQGPVWINMNWLIAEGLERNDQPEAAQRLRRSTIELVRQAAPEHGFHEYYSPLDGSVAGAPDFSWTAALTIDLLSRTVPAAS